MLTVAIVGVTGLVGQKLLEVLAASTLPIERLLPLASARSVGQTIQFRGRRYPVELATPAAFSGVDLAFFAAGSGVSKALVPEAVARGAVVVDKGSAFRLDPKVPLVVPEVNPEALKGHQGLICSPNCSTIQLVVALAPLAAAAGLKRVSVTTYQSVSGTGRAAAAELLATLPRAVEDGAIPAESYWGKPIAMNVLPQCDAFGEGGYTLEEWKLMNETRKILDLPDLPITATAVRVPVVVGHAEAVLVETQEPLTLPEARALLAAAPGVVVIDAPAYPTPLEVAGRPEVFIGRLRLDSSSPTGLHLWVVADNLLKGAATNAVQIGEALVDGGYLR